MRTVRQLTLCIFLISIQHLSGQVLNGSFEAWDTTYASIYQAELDTVYHVPAPVSGEISHWTTSKWGTVRTTDSYAGNYSLILHNWYNYAKEWAYYRGAINTRPLYLMGNYKYTTGGVEGLSQGMVTVALLRNSAGIQDTIATGMRLFDSTDHFIPFFVALNYRSSLSPDTVSIEFVNSDKNCKQGMMCHLLYIDNLTMGNSPVGIKQEAIPYSMVPYPNPCTTELVVENSLKTDGARFVVYDLLGRPVLNAQLMAERNRFDVGSFVPGIYFYTVVGEKGQVFSGKVIKD